MTTAANTNYWRGDITDLRSRAEAVMTCPPATEQMTARTAARVLHGVISLVAQKYGVEEMQHRCAELVRYDATWLTQFGHLPHTDGALAEPTLLIAAVCRGLWKLAGAANLRAALSFWASETDRSVWAEVVAG